MIFHFDSGFYYKEKTAFIEESALFIFTQIIKSIQQDFIP